MEERMKPIIDALISHQSVRERARTYAPGAPCPFYGAYDLRTASWEGVPGVGYRNGCVAMNRRCPLSDDHQREGPRITREECSIFAYVMHATNPG